MKRINRKGFTLIELLAVIIILGVLMIIAIPSVTTYIQNSRKSAWVDTAVAYAKSVVNKVNEGGKLQFFTQNVLYMVPVGHVAKQSCVAVESGGQSPFSDSWAFAYVGVVYNGKGYDYYFIGEDGAQQGIPFVTQRYLNESGVDAMYTTSTDSNTALTGLLKQQYAIEAKSDAANGNGGSGTYKEFSASKNTDGWTVLSKASASSDDKAGLKLMEAYKNSTDVNPNYNKIIIVYARGTNQCEYSPS